MANVTEPLMSTFFSKVVCGSFGECKEVNFYKHSHCGIVDMKGTRNGGQKKFSNIGAK